MGVLFDYEFMIYIQLKNPHSAVSRRQQIRFPKHPNNANAVEMRRKQQQVLLTQDNECMKWTTSDPYKIKKKYVLHTFEQLSIRSEINYSFKGANLMDFNSKWY